MATIEEQMLDEVREQTRWLRLLGLQALRPLLEQVLKTDKQKAVYELTDGRRTSRDVAREAGVGLGTVSRLWSEWMAVGLCSESPTVAGRAQHLSSLSALGFDLPKEVRPAEDAATAVGQEGQGPEVPAP